MAAICESFDPNFIVEPNRELEGIRRLPDLWAKSKERPDIIVLYWWNQNQGCGGGRGQIISYGLHGEKSYTFGAANLLRLLRCTDDKVQEIITFYFPNVEEKQCIVELM